MRRWLFTLLPLILVVASIAQSDRAEACGPGFPPTLLHDREQALLAPLNEPFFTQVQHLVDDLAPADPAFTAVFGEPEGVRAKGGDRERALYEAGAVAFNAHDHDTARAAFLALLALPDTERRHRSTWAAFMLGRLGDTASFDEVRALVAAGFKDDLGLAVASFGEQARQALPLHHPVGSVLPVDENLALVLYGRQARQGADGGISLLQMARDIIDVGGERLEHVASSVVGQRLLTAYAATRADERPIAVAAALDVLVKHDDVAWPDQLAAALYKQGRIDDATRFVAKAPSTPLGLWVRARLAMRAGNLDEARGLLAQASAAFPVVVPRSGPDKDGDGWAYWYFDGTNDITGRRRLLGEQGVLALARREYVFALEHFLKDDVWWRDAAFVAEKVLTIDELKAFVLAHPKYATPAPKDLPSLRSVLARRLARADRLAEAVAFIDDDATRAHVTRLQQLRTDMATDLAELPGAVRDAARLFAEAEILRATGLEVLGTELAPDWSLLGGAYEPWDEQNVDDDGKALPPQPPQPLSSSDERARITAAQPVPNQRFHYRGKAIAIAEQAAALLPHHSQAFAAIMCRATHYANGHDDEVQRLWRHYVAHGAIVVFTGAFGSSLPCPAPDFAVLADIERHRQRKLWLFGGVAAVAFVAALLAVLTARPRR